ncbi:hypothetical protein [Enterococcus timonensis]|uniref:hypothetical protein n=1 Tax=Enterococcus timonensis TaxID=1852364 RepID=UPI0008DA8E6E|nr:hypothetical protein [Enterococcus timonensis]
MAVVWDSKTTLEWLLELKKEIERLGLQDYPSRTIYQEKYDNEKLPSPNSYLNNTGMTWSEILETIGYPIEKIRRAKYKIKNTENMGRPVLFDKTKRETKYGFVNDKLLFKVGELIFKEGIVTKETYGEKRNGELPSYGPLIKEYGSWKHVKELSLKIYRDEME